MGGKFKVYFFFSLIPILISFFCCSPASAARVYGIVMDENKTPLPFATIHVKNTTLGTTANAEGYYAMELPGGKYELVFQHIGYKAANISVEIGNEAQELNVFLAPEVFQLREVVVRPNGEDPAYEIIRNAIRKRKDYLHEVKAYQCDVYIKGLQRLDQTPQAILGIPINLDTGIVYLSESLSKFSYRYPDKIKEEMISSKMSGDNRAFSYNQASEMMFSFYENLIQVEDLNERGFISPIANNAFSYYNYALDGTMEENGYLINKISVIPKRDNDPVFKGKIYIVEDSWRIHSLDLLLTKDNQIEFVDSLIVKQVYAPVDTDTEKNQPWMMLSQQFNFKFKAFGFEGSGYFIGVHSNYQINPTFPRNYFSNEIMAINEEANKRDSSYWERIRPVPLTRIERRDYQEKDSLQNIKESKPYMDSVDQVNNRRLRISNLFLTGYTYRNSYKKRAFSFEPLTRMFQYNTVEGFTPNIRLQYVKSFEDNRFYRISPIVRYGFSNERLNAQVEALYYYNPIRFAYGALAAGRFVEQFNETEPISPFINTAYTLLAQQNFMKLYGKDFIRYRHRTEIANGVLFTGSIEYARRTPLFNTAHFTLNDVDGREFTSNFPEHVRALNTEFTEHFALIANFSLRLRFAQRYISRPNQKIVVGHKHPTITINYRKGVPHFGSDVNFDRAEVNLAYDANLKLAGTSNFSIGAGTFLNRPANFIDLKHFNGNRTLLKTHNNHFQLLDYYFFSTDNYWFEGHFEHHFNGFLFNMVPLIRKLGWQAVLGLNYLYTEDLPHYMEVGFGIEHIFKLGRIDFYRQISPSPAPGEPVMNYSRSGIRLGIGF